MSNFSITILGFLSLFLSYSLKAETILTCTENQTTSIGWQEKSLLKSAKMVAEASSPKNPTSITFITFKDHALLKGNLGTTKIAKHRENFFIEETAAGNIVTWTILPAENGVPTFLIQQKAYNLSGPYTITVAFSCH